MVDIKKLQGIVPGAVINQIPLVVNRFKIDSTLRLAHFLAQCAHESGNFAITQENLNYSADGLLKIFPKYFNAANVNAYARQPEKIANKVYASRMGNSGEASGDGWKYKGRGFIQLTGKNNYSLFDKFVDDDILNNPELVATKFPLLSAAWFWDSVKLNAVADKGNSEEVITLVTKKINGGTHGLEDRINKFNKIYTALK